MDEKIFWTDFTVRFNFITKLCASTPANKELIKKWIEARQPKMRPPGGKTIDEIQAEVFASLKKQSEEEPEAEEEQSLLIFQRDNLNGGNLVMRGDTVRAHFKDCSRVISTYHVGKIEGEKSFASKIKNCCYLETDEYWLPVCRPGGEHIAEPDGILEKPVHATDPRTGRPINALKAFEFINPPAFIQFTIKVVNAPNKHGGWDPVIPIEDLQTLFRFGGIKGYGGERSAGEGKYSSVVRARKDKEHGTDADSIKQKDKGRRQVPAKDSRRDQRSDRVAVRGAAEGGHR